LGSAILGSTISWGVKRGIYSNEAGQGTGPIVAAAAKVSHPVKQGLVQAFSVYIDTLLVCTATALMILACQTYNILDSVQVTSSGEAVVTYLQQNAGAPSGEPGVFYTISAIGTIIGHRAAGDIVSIALFFFAFTTIMAYYYYAETNLVYLFSRFRRWQLRRMREKGRDQETLDKTAAAMERADLAFGDDRSEKIAIWILRICTISTVFAGSLTTSGVTWTLGDIGVGAMAWINLIAIILLSPKALKALRDYEQAKKKGEEPHFDPKKLDVEGAEFWEEL
jgi:AGCS family alanine or glycine:cation symporter